MMERGEGKKIKYAKVEVEYDDGNKGIFELKQTNGADVYFVYAPTFMWDEDKQVEQLLEEEVDIKIVFNPPVIIE